jgi:hypothetical protein
MDCLVQNSCRKYRCDSRYFTISCKIYTREREIFAHDLDISTRDGCVTVERWNMAGFVLCSILFPRTLSTNLHACPEYKLYTHPPRPLPARLPAHPPLFTPGSQPCSLDPLLQASRPASRLSQLPAARWLDSARFGGVRLSDPESGYTCA